MALSLKPGSGELCIRRRLISDFRCCKQEIAPETPSNQKQRKKHRILMICTLSLRINIDFCQFQANLYAESRDPVLVVSLYYRSFVLEVVLLFSN